MLKSTLLSSLKNKLAALVLRKDLNELTTKMDYAEYGGSVLLGLNGIVVKHMVVLMPRHFIQQFVKLRLLEN